MQDDPFFKGSSFFRGFSALKAKKHYNRSS
ncbi:hypothetical protein N399_12860 [Bacillus licheniformis CG-B52]|nr:hypothetical protein N399_12860 [Bacillus licheniformis CG-B52]KUL10907.1 hypothetical protein LI17339_13155 [Bacillus licheniformis LMG 17339]